MKKERRVWRIYPFVMSASEIEAMTLEDFCLLDDEDKGLLRGSGIELHLRLASDDSEIRLAACKEAVRNSLSVYRPWAIKPSEPVKEFGMKTRAMVRQKAIW